MLRKQFYFYSKVLARIPTWKNRMYLLCVKGYNYYYYCQLATFELSVLFYISSVFCGWSFNYCSIIFLLILSRSLEIFFTFLLLNKINAIIIRVQWTSIMRLLFHLEYLHNALFEYQVSRFYCPHKGPICVLCTLQFNNNQRKECE